MAFATSCTSSPSRGSCAESCTDASAARGPGLDRGAPRDPGAAVAAASAADAAEAVSGGRALERRRIARSVPAASDAFPPSFLAVGILSVLCPSSALCMLLVNCLRLPACWPPCIFSPPRVNSGLVNKWWCTLVPISQLKGPWNKASLPWCNFGCSCALQALLVSPSVLQVCGSRDRTLQSVRRSEVGWEGLLKQLEVPIWW